jgi:hypothetical protein
MLYLLARSAACTPFPDPVGPSNTILGVCGALDLGSAFHQYVIFIYTSPHTQNSKYVSGLV